LSGITITTFPVWGSVDTRAACGARALGGAMTGSEAILSLRRVEAGDRKDDRSGGHETNFWRVIMTNSIVASTADGGPFA